MEIDVCPICKDSEESCHLTQKGLSSLLQASKERQDKTLSSQKMSAKLLS